VVQLTGAGQVYCALTKKLAALGYQVTDEYMGESAFNVKDQWQGSEGDAEIITLAYQSFFSENTSI